MSNLYNKEEIVSVSEKYPQYLDVNYLNKYSSAQVVIRNIGYVVLENRVDIDIVVEYESNIFPFEGVMEFESFLECHYEIEYSVSE